MILSEGIAACLRAGLLLDRLMLATRAAKVRFDEDEDFKIRARAAVGLLQGGAPEHLKAWNRICDASRLQFQELYSRLNVTLTERGESFYNPLLQPLVSELLDAGVAVESEDAKVKILTIKELAHIPSCDICFITVKSGILYSLDLCVFLCVLHSASSWRGTKCRSSFRSLTVVLDTQPLILLL